MVKVADISKNAKLIKYFVQRKSTGIGRTKLAKLIYMSDLEARRYVKKPISTFTYVFDNHGPFDSEGFYQAIDELSSIGLILEQEIPLVSDRIKKSITDVPDSAPVPFDFTPAETRILSWTFQEYHSKNLSEFLEDIVYQTPPMKSAERGQALDMSVVEDDHQFQGIDFNVVLQSETEIARGDFKTADEFFSELRDKYTSHSTVTAT